MARHSTPWRRSARMRSRYAAATNGVRGGWLLEAGCGEHALQSARVGQRAGQQAFGLGPGVVLGDGLAAGDEVTRDRAMALAQLQSAQDLSNVQHVSSPSGHGPSAG